MNNGHTEQYSPGLLDSIMLYMDDETMSDDPNPYYSGDIDFEDEILTEAKLYRTKAVSWLMVLRHRGGEGFYRGVIRFLYFLLIRRSGRVADPSLRIEPGVECLRINEEEHLSTKDKVRRIIELEYNELSDQTSSDFQSLKNERLNNFT